MSKEWTLSEKECDMSIYPTDEEAHMFFRKDVKEFISRLKEKFDCSDIDKFGGCGCHKKIKPIIDKLAGENLK